MVVIEALVGFGLHFAPSVFPPELQAAPMMSDFLDTVRPLMRASEMIDQATESALYAINEYVDQKLQEATAALDAQVAADEAAARAEEQAARDERMQDVFDEASDDPPLDVLDPETQDGPQKMDTKSSIVDALVLQKQMLQVVSTGAPPEGYEFRRFLQWTTLGAGLANEAGRALLANTWMKYAMPTGVDGALVLVGSVIRRLWNATRPNGESIANIERVWWEKNVYQALLLMLNTFCGTATASMLPFFQSLKVLFGQSVLPRFTGLGVDLTKNVDANAIYNAIMSMGVVKPTFEGVNFQKDQNEPKGWRYVPMGTWSEKEIRQLGLGISGNFDFSDPQDPFIKDVYDRMQGEYGAVIFNKYVFFRTVQALLVIATLYLQYAYNTRDNDESLLSRIQTELPGDPAGSSMIEDAAEDLSTMFDEMDTDSENGVRDIRRTTTSVVEKARTLLDRAPRGMSIRHVKEAQTLAKKARIIYNQNNHPTRVVNNEDLQKRLKDQVKDIVKKMNDLVRVYERRQPTRRTTRATRTSVVESVLEQLDRVHVRGPQTRCSIVDKAYLTRVQLRTASGDTPSAGKRVV